eukprot:scaffold9276_cov112-Isochrysis_galbana.AAC.5
MVDSCLCGTVSWISAPFGSICSCAATLWLLRRRSPGVYSLTTPTHRGGVMCKALAGAGRLSEQTFCRTNMDLQLHWVKWRGSLAHSVVLRWVARTFRRRGDVHDGVCSPVRSIRTSARGGRLGLIFVVVASVCESGGGGVDGQ